MIFLKKRNTLLRELDELQKAKLDASKKVQVASKRLDTVIAENGFHLVLHKAIVGEKRTNAS